MYSHLINCCFVHSDAEITPIIADHHFKSSTESETQSHPTSLVSTCNPSLQLTVTLTEPSVVTHQSLDVIHTHRVEVMFGALKQVVALFI